MAETSTRTQVLTEAVLGRPLGEYVAEKRRGRPRWSWALIAEQLSDDTGGKAAVTGETLRLWYGESERGAA